jgi:hypothetical protein
MEEFWKVTYTGAKLEGKFLEDLLEETLGCASQFGWITPRRKES